MKENEIIIYTDGSSRGNPGPGGCGFVAIYESHGTTKVEEGGGKEAETTNNRMELYAVIRGILYFHDYFVPGELRDKIFRVYCDSAYVINGITKWVFGWEKNGWKTSLKEDVSNVDLWKRLREATDGKRIEWIQLKGHAGVAGNERCDEIATAYADSVSGGEEPNLFKGNLSDYSRDVLNFAESGEVPSKKGGSKAKAYSYVSMVDGVVMVHKTWEECEKRVKGAKGAKYQKALNEADEAELMKKLGNI